MSAARLAREEETIAFRTSRVASRLGAEGEACEAIGAEPPRRGHRAWMARRARTVGAEGSTARGVCSSSSAATTCTFEASDTLMTVASLGTGSASLAVPSMAMLVSTEASGGSPVNCEHGERRVRFGRSELRREQ